jgi:tungstate transport system substrate-binding protein
MLDAVARLLPLILVWWAALPLFTAACGDGERQLVLGAASSLNDSRLLDELAAGFERESGYEVKPVAGGSGQLLEMARRGELDAAITHSPADEEKLVAEGVVLRRTPVFQNFFVLAGPREDPAGVRGAGSVAEAFRRIAAGGYAFISRGDGSGTHKRELEIWAEAGIDPAGESWYRESATGQGQNLLIADEAGAYTLTDSSTLRVMQGRLRIEKLLVDRGRPNVYSVLVLNGQRFGRVNQGAAEEFLAYLTGPGREIVAEYGRAEYGAPLFEVVAEE